MLAFNLSFIFEKEDCPFLYEANEELRRSKKRGPDFSKDHIPHITLAQWYGKEEDLSKITEKIEPRLNTFLGHQLTPELIEKNGKCFSLLFEEDNELFELQDEVAEVIVPYGFCLEDARSCFVTEPRAETVEYVNEFFNNIYDPHITLGFGLRLDNVYIPQKLNLNKVSISQMDNFNTVTNKRYFYLSC